eukprot:3249608-Prymnesium_polylepis.1
MDANGTCSEKATLTVVANKCHGPSGWQPSTYVCSVRLCAPRARTSTTCPPGDGTEGHPVLAVREYTTAPNWPNRPD